MKLVEKKENIFNKYYELLDQDIKDYFNKHVESNSKSIKANLELILTFKRLSQIKKAIDGLNNDEVKLVEKKENIFNKYYVQLSLRAQKVYNIKYCER